jgi:hypothetical protein
MKTNIRKIEFDEWNYELMARERRELRALQKLFFRHRHKGHPNRDTNNNFGKSIYEGWFKDICPNKLRQPYEHKSYVVPRRL